MNWNDLGKFAAAQLDLQILVRTLMVERDVDEGIFAWLATEQGGTAVRGSIESLADVYLTSKVVTPPPLLVPTVTHVLAAVPVNYDLAWDENIRRAGPNTPANYDIWRADGVFPKAKSGIVPTDITLVNFGESVNSEPALAYAQANSMRTINGYEAFAVGEHHPKLNRTLLRSCMGVVSLEKQIFEGGQLVVYVWFGEDERGAVLLWFDDRWDDGDWFGFVSEHPKST